jgi:N-acetyltransferase
MKKRIGDPWIPAETYGQSLAGLTANLLVSEVAQSVVFAACVLDAHAVYSDADFAVLRHQEAEWMVHADHTYKGHPLCGSLAPEIVRGIGIELRLHGRDPDTAEAAARQAGYTVLAGSSDKPHGLREAHILDPDGYCWVPDIPLKPPASTSQGEGRPGEWLRPLVLGGSNVSLVPLARSHIRDLEEALRDGELWKLWYTTIPSPEELSQFIDQRLAAQAKGTLLPFAVIENASGKAVGMTNYLNIDRLHRRVEIGGTWYRERLQRSLVNTQCKFLLLEHAFDVMHCIAVEFRTHFFNQQSRRGIERLGAKLDGVLRSHQVADNGTLRDTCVYSIIACEWPTVRAHLAWRMDKPRPRAAG